MGDLVYPTESGIITTLDLDPDLVLKAALENKLEMAVVIGVRNGELYFASSAGDGGEVMWWMEKAKKALLEL
jgi:hypothetical protein